MLIINYALLPVRGVLIILAVLAGLLAQLAFFGWVKPASARRIVTLWSRGMLACLGVGLHIEHAPQAHTHTSLVVSNHVSWLDILALQAAAPVVFVAKSEIRSWPVLGWMVSLAGTCFIDRSRRTALRTVHTALTAHLQAAQSVCIFPEGTTSDGQQVLPFHAGLLQAAIDAGVPVQPIRLRYSHPTAAYIGDMTLWNSLLNVLLTPRLLVNVQVLACVPSAGESRQRLAHVAHEAISNRSA